MASNKIRNILWQLYKTKRGSDFRSWSSKY